MENKLTIQKFRTVQQNILQNVVQLQLKFIYTLKRIFLVVNDYLSMDNHLSFQWLQYYKQDKVRINLWSWYSF